MKKQLNKTKKANIAKALGFGFMFLTFSAAFVAAFAVEIGVPGKKIIAESSYVNYAWGFQYKGEIICDDGSIFEAQSGDGGMSEIEYSLTARKVSQKDLSGIKKLIALIDKTKLAEKHCAYDMGSYKVSAFTQSGESVMLCGYGDRAVLNTDKNSAELINLIAKYLSSAERIRKQTRKDLD